jgi:GNAT superfamily N-acetyltransferase
MEERSTFRILPLSVELLDPWLDFFDGRAFADNPEWSHCYCTFYHKSGKPGASRITNRNLAIRLIREGGMKGYLGLDGEGRVVAWCNANDRSAFARLGETEARFGEAAGAEAGTAVESRVLSIVCFLVEKAYRGRGAASALLSRILSDAEADGYDAVEAYPNAEARTEAGNYHGPRALYEGAGFEIAEKGGRLVARRALAGRMAKA